MDGHTMPHVQKISKNDERKEWELPKWVCNNTQERERDSTWKSIGVFHMITGRKRRGGGFNALILHIILKLGALLKNQSIAAPFYNIPSDGWLPIQHPIPLSFFFVFHRGITGTLQPAVNLPFRENVVGV